MAVYSKLLLNAGGGVISTQQQAKQAENTATIIIGVGGTGLDALRTLKTQVYTRLQADNPDAVSPEYQHIRFIGVDTDKKAAGNEEDDENANNLLPLIEGIEFFDIGNADIGAALAQKQALAMRRDLTWLNHENMPAPAMGKAGAGGKRQVGRFMLMDKSDLFLAKLRQEISTAKKGLINPTVNIHILSGLSGGTGAGCYLDVCYMVRHIADAEGGVNTFGYFFLPDVNLDKIPEKDILTRGYVPKNGYASMQELDYCMQMQYNGGAFVQEYKDGTKIEWKKPPVDMCHLICATDANENVIENAYNYAMNVTTEYIMDFLTYTTSNFTLSSQLANFVAKVGAADGGKYMGVTLDYCVIGASCATVPLREINTYLASKLFESFTAVKTTKPTEGNVQQLAITALGKSARDFSGIYNSLHREILEKADTGYQPYAQDWKYVRDNGNEDMVNHFTNQTAQKKGFIETNTQSMITPTNNASLIARVRTALLDVIKDVEKGPSYAFDMISASESHNLLNVIEGLIKENEARYDQEAYQTTIRRQEYDTAKAEFDNAGGLFPNYKGKFETYKFALQNHQQNQIDVYAYEQIRTLLAKLKEQVEEVRNNYYTQFKRVTDTLINTFKDNKSALDVAQSLQTTASFEIPMMTINELIPTLDKVIEPMNISGVWGDLISLFVGNENEWIEEDENKIAKLVTKFFVENIFSDFANKTINSFLADKYGTTNDAVLAEKVYKEWMTVLTQKASPMFYFDGGIWGQSKTGQIASISIPDQSVAITTAAEKMKSIDSVWDIKASGLTDRIYVMSSCCALPLCSYKNIRTYEDSYYKAYEPGRHYYEGKDVPDMKFNNWKEILPITPQSLIDVNTLSDAIKPTVQNAKDLYETAFDMGILTMDNAVYALDKEVLEAQLTKAKTLNDTLSETNIEDAKEFLEVIKALKDTKNLPKFRTDCVMKNDGLASNNEVKKRVNKDHFVSTPAYHKVVEGFVEEILGVAKHVDTACTNLENAITGFDSAARNKNQSAQNIDGFFNSVFTGVIGLNERGNIITYTQVDFGISTDVVLFDVRQQNQFAIPLYQAFLNFNALDVSLQDEIKAKANDVLVTGFEQVETTCKQLQVKIADEKIQAWAQVAASLPEKAVIIDFLKKMKQAYQNFCVMNL